MRLGGEVQDGIGLEPAQQFGDRGAIADIGAPEAVPRIVLDRLQRAEIRGIGQLVDVDHLGADLADQKPRR